MAIRENTFTVSANGIEPTVEQSVGLQGENGATELEFIIESGLYEALLRAKQDTDRLIYRFDFADGMGNVTRGNTARLESNTLKFDLREWATRYSGKAKVYLMIARLNSGGYEQMSFISDPARLRFTATSIAETEKERESLSTLTEIAKEASEEAQRAAATAVEAQEKTEAAKVIFEKDTVFVFDGNNTSAEMEIAFAVDESLSEASGNAVANKAVTEELNNVKDKISSITANKQSTYDPYISDIDADKKYLSVAGVKDFYDKETKKTLRIVESGTSGIWTYRKWSDGMSECWAKKTVAVLVNKSWGALFTTENIPETNLTFPFEFIELPNIQVSLVPTSQAGFIGLSGNGEKASKTKTGEYMIFRGTNAETTVCNYTLDYMVVGRWR